MSCASRRVLESCKASTICPKVLLAVLHVALPDFRPFCVLLIVAYCLFWDCSLESRPIPSRAPILRVLCNRVWTLRTTRPIATTVGCVLGIGTIVFLVYCILPSWVSLVVAGILVYWDPWHAEPVQVSSNPTGSEDTLTEQELAEFVPELTDASRVLLQVVGEQGAAVVPAADGKIADAGQLRAEEDEELYLSTMIPEANSNDFESAELSGSSSDELFCPEGPVLRKHVAGRQQAHGRGNSTATTGDRPIEFKSSHFNANSSSDSDDNMSRGLCFNDENDEEGRPRHDRMSASSLASNVLVDTVFRRLLDTATQPSVQQPLLALQPAVLQSVGLDLRKPVGGTIRAVRGQPVAEVNDESTDGDEDSDFEMLNSEELNSL
ncbi:uncharacterized protein LOC128728455 [Anopheles nili]|uniref:uncharacterized protein LOC128728455 n=1 Tax=Anopheles nili TaxID=185578 RepID=UPI00237A49AA|nr:uncharacterized protein LOC128728455 [Anopheles nili]